VKDAARRSTVANVPRAALRAIVVLLLTGSWSVSATIFEEETRRFVKITTFDARGRSFLSLIEIRNQIDLPSIMVNRQ
jgi:hypothetical protein